ncbi:MAG: winged helix-turn-helix transcriptional regulator [Candidatus Heimdallarchaeota archaeon]|nr:winged helix-turn-helix transcriptional regulator [Candidatus Heimdallarchaeota archaeon]
MSDPELTRKLSEMQDNKLAQWESIPSRIEDLKHIQKMIQTMTTNEKYIHFKRVIKALNHPARVKILTAIKHGAICPCELEYITELAQATVSHHLSILEDASLIKRNRKGKWTIIESSEKIPFDRIIPF